MKEADLYADVVVVGTGIAGGLVAKQLAEAGIDVMCLEAGPPINRSEALGRFINSPDRGPLSPYENTSHAPHASTGYIEETGSNHYGCQYVRGVGGTTWCWAGECWRYTPEEFMEYSLYGVGRDMPVGYAELEDYYYRAELEIGVAGVSEQNYYDVKRARPYPMQAMPLSYYDSYLKNMVKQLGMTVKQAPAARNTESYDGRPRCCGSNNCIPICPVGAKYDGDQHIRKVQHSTAPARLISNAVVDYIKADKNGSVQWVRYRDPSGGEHLVRGKYYVLAANGIEIPKLLLLSRQKYAPQGIGNRYDMVGRFLMDHPGTNATFLSKDPVYSGRGPQSMSSIIDFQQGEFKQRHAGMRINFFNQPPAEWIVDQAMKEGYLGQALDKRIIYLSNHLVQVNAFHGQLPEAHNRVTLSNKKDALGIRRPRINFQVGEWTYSSAFLAAKKFKEISSACGGLEFKLGASPANPDRDTMLHFQPNHHIMGTTIMGTMPEDSVVDNECRVHGYHNLFISSSSVMAVSGVNNVTLTIAALAIRLADTIRSKVIPA